LAAGESIKRQQLQAQLEVLHGQGDLIGAKNIASQLAARTNGDEHLAWIGRCNELRAEIVRSWSWMTGSDEIGDFWMSGVKARRAYSAPEPWVEPGGVTAICFVVSGRSLLLVRYNLESARVESWARMMLPQSVDNIDLIRVTDEVAVLVADEAAVLLVNLRNWEILDCYEIPVSVDWKPGACVVSRDACWLWCAQTRLRDAHWEWRVQAMEIASRRVIRTFCKADLIPAAGSLDVEVGVVHDDCISFHRANGSALSGLTVSASLTVVVQAPSGHGLVGIVEEDDSSALTLLGPMLPGKLPAELVLKGSSGPHQLAVALDHSMLVARYYADGEQWLEAFDEADGRLASLYRVPISDTALLLSDHAGRCVWVMDIEGRRLVARRIGREPQRLLFDHPHDVP